MSSSSDIEQLCLIKVSLSKISKYALCRLSLKTHEVLELS